MEEDFTLNHKVKDALEARAPFVLKPETLKLEAPKPAARSAARHRRLAALRWAAPTLVAASLTLALVLHGLVDRPAAPQGGRPFAGGPAVSGEVPAVPESATLVSAGSGAVRAEVSAEDGTALTEALSLLLEAEGVDAEEWESSSPEDLLLAWQEAPYAGSLSIF